MKIKTKISLLVTSLIALVVGSIVANLIWVEQRRVKADFSARVDALMEGVLRIARESLTTQDELMLLSYVKFLRRDYPEIELVIVSRQGHTSLIGEVKTALFYRTITLTERKAAEFKADTAARAAGAPAGATLPPNTFSIQLGFSRSLLDRRIREAQLALARQILSIAGIGMLLGVGGSLWLGRLLSRPVTDLSEAARRLGEGELDAAVSARGKDEIGRLGLQFNEMAGKLGDLIRFKEDLMSTLSHELNTPLGGVKGFVEYLQRTEQTQKPQERREAYATMADAIRQMEISLTNALQLFRSETRPALHPETLSVREIFAEAARLFSPMAQANGIALEGPSQGAGAELAADKELLRRVCVNLVSNALKYTPPGGTVAIEVSDDGSEVHALVRDTGPGIAPADKERIFTKFYRAGQGGAAKRIPGSGLGLAIAKKAVELHQGRIWVESELGKGSVFHVTLPKNPKEAA